MNNFYSSRKIVLFRYTISIVICILSFVLGDDNDFRMFMGLLVFAMLGIMFISNLFWKGFDNGKFSILYSESNLKSRDFVLRFCSILVMHGTIVTSVFGIFGENIYSIISVVIIITLFLIESYFLFKLRDN